MAIVKKYQLFPGRLTPRMPRQTLLVKLHFLTKPGAETLMFPSASPVATSQHHGVHHSVG